MRKRQTKKKRKITEKDGKFYTPRGVELTRCSNTKTEAEFFSWIRSNCRKMTTRWKPRFDKLAEGKRKSESDNKRLKWEYSCEECEGWFPGSQIEIDHIVPCGGLNGWDKILPWFKNALVEIDGYQRLCKTCHRIKTNEEQDNG